MSDNPFDVLREVIRDILAWPDDYVTIDGAPEAVIGPQYPGEPLRGKVRLSPRRASRIGTGRANTTAVTETVGGRDYLVVTQSGIDAWRVDVRVEAFGEDTYAGDVSREIARGLEDLGPRERLQAGCTSVARIGDTVDADLTIDGKTLSAASLELLVYYKWERVDKTSREFMETANIERVT